MKYCPTCETRYDEEILRFCTKDGTPLLEVDEPHFIQMPSESLDRPVGEDDDEGDVTVVRRNIPVPPLPPSADDDFSDVRPHDSGQRIVVPTVEERQEVRARVIPPYQPPPQRSNTVLTVLLTAVGTLAVVAIGLLGFYLLQSEPAANANTNININANLANANMNVNTNVGLDTNFNFNLNANSTTNTNVNTNVNANLRTPTPTPRPSPSVTPSPTPDDEDETPTPTPARTPAPTPTPIIIRPGVSPTPRVTPRATRTPSDPGQYRLR